MYTKNNSFSFQDKIISVIFTFIILVNYMVLAGAPSYIAKLFNLIFFCCLLIKGCNWKVGWEYLIVYGFFICGIFFSSLVSGQYFNLFTLLLVSFFFIISFNDKIRLNIPHDVIVFSFVISILYCVVPLVLAFLVPGYGFVWLFDESSNFIGLSVHYNYNGLAVGIMLGLAWVVRGKIRFIFSAIYVLSLLIAFMGGSRTTLLMVISFPIIVKLSRVDLKYQLLFLLVAIVMILIIAPYSDDILEIVYSLLGRTNVGHSDAGRYFILSSYFDYIVNNPLGAGKSFSLEFFGIGPVPAHNGIVQAAVSYGWVSAFLYFCLIVNLYRKSSSVSRCFLIFFIFNVMFQPYGDIQIFFGGMFIMLIFAHVFNTVDLKRSF